MVTSELMIGDWVFAPDNKNKPLKPKKVMAIDFTTNHILVYNPKTKETTDVDLADCEPILLTVKTLFINDFTKFVGEYGNVSYNYRVDGNLMLHIVDEDKELKTVIGGIFRELKYIHKLQHVLRLADLDKVANEFKVE